MHSVSGNCDLRRTTSFLERGGRRAYAAVLAGGLLLTGCQRPQYVQFGGYAQGGIWSVKANLQGVREKPKSIQYHIEEILHEVDTTLSGYNKGSQLSRFNAGEPVEPSPMFLEVMEAAVRFWKETDGAVDCAAGPLFDIWGFGFKTDSLPSDDLVRQTMARCGMARLVCSENWPNSGTNSEKTDICSEKLPISGTNYQESDVRGQKRGDLTSKNSKSVLGAFKQKARERIAGQDCKEELSGISESLADGQCWGGLPLRDTTQPFTRRGEENAGRAVLNYNAIAQGYSCDKVAEYLYSIGVKDMLVDIGEIFCDGLNPKGEPWRIGIDRPKDGNNTPGAELDGIWESDGAPHGVVTSGNYRKFYIKDGVKYSHTIDPRTGYPVQHNLLSATVIAPTALDADAYATYCMVIGFEAARDFILSRNDLEGCLIYGADHIWTSPGFEKSKR